jgi:hypothetical protein
MNTAEWTWKGAERLYEQWPRGAEALHRKDRWKDLEPDEAALECLAQGIPASRQVLTNGRGERTSRQ